MKRILALLASSVLLAVGFTAPAHASNPGLDKHYNKCIGVGEGATVCMEVYGHSIPGGGVTINHVYLEAFGKDFIWETKAVACSNVRIWNQNSVIQWRKDGAECDIYKPSMMALFTPSVEANRASSLTVGWTFSPKLNDAPDPGSQHISITVP